MQKTIVLFTLIILIGTFTACQSASPQNEATEDTASFESTLPSQNTILVNSSEEVSIIPDMAEIVYSVRTQSSTAALCRQQNSDAVSEIINLLLGLEIAETSIQTSDYYMNPIYNYSNNTPRVTGYEAITSLTVSDLPIERLDDILAQSVDNGINTIQSITYQASGYDESYQQALNKAVATARQKAQVLASAAGCQLGDVVNIQETSGYSDARYTDSALASRISSMSAKAEMADDASAAGIMAGKIQVSASIVVEYQLLLSPVIK